jgi:CBS domain-containing protein
MRTTIRDILRAKGSEVITCEADESVFAAVEKMVAKKVGAVVVMEGGSLCGIFSERDFLRSYAVDHVDPKTTAVKSVSSCNVVCVAPDEDVEEAMAVMTEVRIRHLPVIEAGKLVGVVSIGDLVKQVSRDREAHIHYLTDFVSGKYPG